MNGFLIFGVVSLILLYLWEVLVELSNVRYAKAHGVPEELRSEVDQAKYQESLRYLQANTQFSLLEAGVSLALTLIFWLCGGFGLLDNFARSLGYSSITTGLVFVGCLGGLSFLLGIPFSFYHTFRIEAAFGFNRTSVRTFILDRVKGILLSILLGAPILAGILWFFENAGNYAWLMAWGFLLAIQVLLLFIAPVFLLPLFNKFTPLPEGELRQAIEAMAQKQNFQLTGIFTMDGSKRSSKGNAFFTGFGKNRRIALFDTLIEKQTTAEIVAVLAHEIGHAKLRHVPKMFFISASMSLLLFWVLSLLMGNQALADAFFVQPSVYASLVFAGFLYGPVGRLENIFTSMLSREHEFQADAFAKSAVGSGNELASALKKLSVDSLSNLNPHPWKVATEYSHPPVIQRLRALRD